MSKQRLPIRQIRDRMGMSQVAFGKLVGIHERIVAEWERGQSKPSPVYEREIHAVIARWFLDNMLRPSWKVVFDHIRMQPTTSAALFGKLSRGRELPDGFRAWELQQKIKWLDANWPLEEGYRPS